MPDEFAISFSGHRNPPPGFVSAAMREGKLYPSPDYIKLSITVVESCSEVAFWEQSRILSLKLPVFWGCLQTVSEVPLSLEMLCL